MPDPLNNEKEILHQVAAGSAEAFATLFNHYRAKLFTNLFHLTKSREIAEDIVHEVFLKIWAARAQLTTIDNFNAYLHTISRNLAYNGFKRAAKETLILAELRRDQSASGPVTAATPATQLMSKEVRAFIRETVDRLSPQQKTIFLMSREEGLKHEEIARRVGISVSTVKTHMGLALKFLRDEISGAYGPSAIAIFVIFHLYT